MENFVLEPTELATERPDLQFEEGRYSIPEILDSHLLPLVVQYDSGGQPAPFNKFHFDLTQPLLLYKKRNIQKVAASSLHIQGDQYEDLGESLLIPEDYKGWFAVLQRLTGCTKADDTVPHFASVEELANSNTERFLIGGTKKITGLQIIDRSEGQIKHEQRHFFPGDSLTAGKVEYGEAKKRTRLFRKPKYIHEKFLMCTDETDRDILLPFEQEGIFYQISHKSGKPVKNVMQMSDIVARKLTPRIIKLVFGRFPVTPCAFTGLMKAESSRIETSVIAATILNKQNILMEIPLNNEIFFNIAITNDALRQNSCYRNAMHFCAERASTYMRNIKICYNFALRGEMDTHDFILKTPPPDTCVSSPEQGYVPFDGIGKTPSKIPAEGVRHSDISDISEVSIRPGRCASTGRMSFCLGNSYLTVPVYDDENEKRNSGNNNTAPEMPPETKRTSFKGKFLEMEGSVLSEEDETFTSSPEEEDPPPIACANISSYVNRISPPIAEVNPEFPDYIPTSLSRRPSSQPPDMAPPPLPLSSSTSGVSSGSVSSMSDGVNSNRASSASIEYDVPKTDSPGSSYSSASMATISPDICTVAGNSASALVRRPSTYQFAEGCQAGGRSLPKNHVELMEELEESRIDVDSPIYENIQSLMEICKKLDLECGHIEMTDSNSELDCSVSDGSLTELSSIPGDLESVKDDHIPVCVPNEYCESPIENIENSREHLSKEMSPREEVNRCGESLNIQTFAIRGTDDDGAPTPSHSCSTLSASPKSLKSLGSESFQIGNSTSTTDERCDSDCGSSEAECNDAYGDANVSVVETEMQFEIEEQDQYHVYDHSIQREPVTSSINTRMPSEQESKCNANLVDATHKIIAIYEGNENIEIVKLRAKDTTAEIDDDDKTTSTYESDKCLPSVSDESAELDETCRRAFRKVQKTKSFNTANEECDFPSDHDRLRRLSSSEVRDHFKAIGIREATLNQVEQLDINGTVLIDVLNGERSIRESMAGINLIDQQKISMFIRGWRPQLE